MDYTFIVLIIGAFLSLLSALLVFAFRDILHSVLALTLLFLFNSLLFLVLDQPLLAVIQLFIMIGGISTFLFVGVATAELLKFKFTRWIGLTAIWMVLFAVLSYPIYRDAYTIPETSTNVFGAANISSSLSQYPGIFYAIMMLLFAISLGSIVVLKRAGREK